MNADPDVALMTRLQNGDDSALNSLMSRWQNPLLNFLYRYTGSYDDALDLAQETFLRVYEHRQRFEPRGRFSSWLFTIASNLTRNLARWRSRHPTVSIHAPPPGEDEESDDVLEDLPSGERTPADNAEREDLAGAVREHIQQLPHDLRSAVLLFEYQELSHAEIAQTLGCTPKAIETRLYRARELLRKALAPWRSRARGSQPAPA